MRILLSSDLHYKLRQYDWLIKAAKKFDAVVIAGDHIDAFWPVPTVVQIEALRASFTAIAKKSHLFVSSGNHDLNARSPAGEKTANWLEALRGPTLSVDGDSSKLGDTLFTVCPWWDGPHAKAELEKLLEAAAKRRPARWVWVYHAPPPGPLSWTGKRHYADDFLLALIGRFKPTAVLCGHIHEAPFTSEGSWSQKLGNTWVFNAGRQDGSVPARVEIDLTENQASWFSIKDNLTQSLAS